MSKKKRRLYDRGQSIKNQRFSSLVRNRLGIKLSELDRHGFQKHEVYTSFLVGGAEITFAYCPPGAKNYLIVNASVPRGFDSTRLRRGLEEITRNPAVKTRFVTLDNSYHIEVRELIGSKKEGEYGWETVIKPLKELLTTDINQN